MSVIDRMKTFFRMNKHVDIPEVQMIWHHQIVVIQSHVTIELVHPLLDLTQSAVDIGDMSTSFPLVVGDHGLLLSANVGRKVSDASDLSNPCVYLTYLLRGKTRGRIILKIKGCDPQTIEVFRDDRKDRNVPLVLFLRKQT